MKLTSHRVYGNLVYDNDLNIRTIKTEKGMLRCGSWKNDIAHIWHEGLFYRITKKGTLLMVNKEVEYSDTIPCDKNLEEGK